MVSSGKFGHEKSGSDTIIAVALAILAISSFVWQVSITDQQTTQRETVLFNLLQLLLTLGFSWYGSRAVSGKSFEKSIKKFAIGAYRRISDIDEILGRLQSRLQEIVGRREKAADYSELSVVSAIVEDTKQIINASILDWTDVIGDELMAVNRVKDLELQLRNQEEITATVDKKIEENRAKLTKEIASLKASLPAKLQRPRSYVSMTDESLKRGVKWLVHKHRTEDGLRLEVRTGGQYGEMDESLKLVPTDHLVAEFLDTAVGINVYNKSKILLGRVLNFSPYTYIDFKTILSECYGTKELKVEVSEVVNSKSSSYSPTGRFVVKVLSNHKNGLESEGQKEQ